MAQQQEYFEKDFSLEEQDCGYALEEQEAEDASDFLDAEDALEEDASEYFDALEEQEAEDASDFYDAEDASDFYDAEDITTHFEFGNMDEDTDEEVFVDPMEKYKLKYPHRFNMTHYTVQSLAIQKARQLKNSDSLRQRILCRNSWDALSECFNKDPFVGYKVIPNGQRTIYYKRLSRQFCIRPKGSGPVGSSPLARLNE
jgi:hypothetical protein